MTVAPSLGAKIKFDAVNHNASRIWKFYGTLAMKGEPSDERPHRMAACLLPDDAVPVPLKLLEDYAGAPGAEQFWQDALRGRKKGSTKVDHEGREKHKPGKGDYSTCDVVQLFEDKDMYRYAMREDGKHSVYCPWADEHSSTQHAQGSDTILWEPDPDGGDERQWPVFHCSHDACGEAGLDGKRTFDSVRKLWGNAEVDKYCKDKYDSFRSINQSMKEIAASQGSKAPPSPLTTPPKKTTKPVKSEGGNTPPEEPPPPTGQIAEPTEAGKRKQEEIKSNTKTFSPLVSYDHDSSDIPLVVRWRWLRWADRKLIKDERCWFWTGDPNPQPEEMLQFNFSDPAKTPAESTGTVGAGVDPANEVVPPTPSGAPPPMGDDGRLGLGGDSSNTPENVHANLVAILGTKFTYHISRDILMPPDAVRHSFPKLGNEWLKSTERRAVWKSDFIFDPTKPRFDPNNPDVLNRFTGFEPPEGEGIAPTLILEHMKYLCGGDEAAYEFVLKWHALQFQKIGTKMESALIFKGAHGTGKNMLFTRICNDLFGKYGTTITATQLASQYNDWASCKMYILANEVSTRRDRVDIQNKLKALITDEDMMINAKFKDNIPEKNFFNLVMFSNQSNPVTIEDGDRRYLVCEIPEAKDETYYGALGREINAGGIVGLYHYLMKMDLTGFTKHTKPPMTQSKADSIADRLPPHDKFFDRLKKNHVEMQFRELVHTGVIEKKALWRAFQLWKKHHGYKSDWCTTSVFCHRADRVLGQRRTINVQITKDNGAVVRTKRTYYILADVDPDAKLNGAEIHLSASHFEECVVANEFGNPPPPVETLNTAPNKDWEKDMKPKKED
jgi:hypothetical protein